ncbi:MAG: class I SAM-dependent methyltransferase [Cyclonatronaceae bacterium]
MSAQWFETWFDTPLYEQLYAHRDEREARQLARLIAAYFPPSVFPSVLDVACGRGRHSLNLARLGFEHILGVDLAANAIIQAKEKAAKEPPETACRLRFKKHDMREPVQDRFDLVVNLFTSFGYMPEEAENRQILAHMLDSVDQSGAFVMDFLNAPAVRSGLIPEEEMRLNTYALRIRREIKDGAVHKKMRFTHAETGETQAFTERVALYDADWFRQVLSENGFRISHLFGTYDGAPYDEESPRLILFARPES